MATVQEQTAQLLKAPAPEAVDSYLKELVASLKANNNVEVRVDAGGGKGKGLFAIRNYKEGDVIFREHCLVGCQDRQNRAEAQVCAQCYRFTGSIESQMARHLLSMVSRHDALVQKQERQAAREAKAEAEAPSEAKAAASGSGEADEAEDAEADSDDMDSDDEEDLAKLQDKVKKINRVGASKLEALLTKELELPGSEKIKLPQALPCRRGCGEEYCSAACEQAAWERCHCLMCPMADPASQAGQSGAADADAAPSASSAAHPDGEGGTAPSTSSDAAASSGVWEVVNGVRVNRAALREFYGHANATNEIFILVAKVIAVTLINAHNLLQAGGAAASTTGAAEATGDTAAATATAAAAANAPSATSAAADASVSTASGPAEWAALQAAWLPFAMGWKDVWWRSVAKPDDVEDEAEFRKELEDLARDSLDLLKSALIDERFPALFALEVYGSVVGMFELNNLELQVLSPLADYFDMIDDMPKARKMAAKKVVQPFKDALGDDYDVPCQGTAFYRLQSCANHSCLPNAESETDPLEGIMHMTATKAIKKGEEVCVTYIDADAPYEERKEELRDYGFECSCAKCARQAQKTTAGK